MGMTYEQYWDGDPQLVVAYRKAFRLRREIENEQAWLQGLYIYDAFSVCMANAFAKKGAKPQKYIEHPIDIYPPSESEKRRRAEEEQRKMEAALKAMIAQQKREKAKG